ncbi:MAG: hypothetical protein DI547_04800 [Sphingobium sp.]|nr:MAG: hypothetical protein DI547_04800 [Sphingobium sp.]
MSDTQAVEKLEVRNRWTNRVQFTAEITCAPDAAIGVKLGLAVQWARKSGAVLSDADLSDADLSDADLSGADLSGADLSDADLRRADLSGAVLRRAVLRDADLSDADLRRAVLSGAVLSGADLSGADLSDADLRRADLSGAVLRGADLRGADLRRAVLRDADLSDADLRRAVLSGAVLRGYKADFFMNLLRARDEVPYLIAALKEGRVDGSQYEGECACLVGTLANGRGASYHDMFPDAYSGNPAEQWFLMIRKGDKPGDDTGGGFASQKALEWAEEFQLLMGVEESAAA